MKKDFLFYALKTFKNNYRFCPIYSCFLGSRNDFLFLDKFITIESLFTSALFFFLCLKNKSSLLFFCKNHSAICIYKAIALQSNSKFLFHFSNISTHLNFENTLMFAAFSKEYSILTKHLFDNCIPCISFVDNQCVSSQISFPIFLNNHSTKTHFFLTLFLNPIILKTFLTCQFRS